ncbi:MAG: dihydropteroate synthase, partial [Clostridia bacterium]|nr:dihydropteroate synthase [Clostridia bacterium]
NAYGEDGHLMTGASPAAMAALLEGMGADMIGLNCSFGPKQLAPVARELLRVSSRPVVLKPNAGIPRDVDGKTVFDVGPEEFAADVAALVREGVRVVGGCCGTTPEYIAALRAAVREIEPVPVTAKDETVISSYTKAVSFGADPVMIGERINPTGKKRMQQALRAGDLDLILEEGIGQQEAGAKVLDVNVGLPDLDEAALLPQVVEQLQAVCDLPLQLDSADPVAMEAALRAYNGKPLINSVNGKAESLAAVLPLVKKYGGVVVALTLDEAGIPADAEGRVAIAKKILQAAEEAGIDKKDLLFDPLAMAVSADPGAARVTLEAVERITRELGCRTVLGVSNISFGLPARGALNGAFLSAALARGLSAAILNPHSPEMQRAWCAHRALHGLDADFSSWLVFAALDTVRAVKAEDAAAAVPAEEPADGSALQRAIVKGLKDQAGALAAELLTETEPLALVQQEIIPALDRVGQGFERKTVYLPQLLMAAEAAKSAFAEVKRVMERGDRPAESAVRCPVVLATVEGDIHDI